MIISIRSYLHNFHPNEKNENLTMKNERIANCVRVCAQNGGSQKNH